MKHKILYNLIIVFSTALTLISCTGEDTCNATYFGGHIINPKGKLITLSKDGAVIDSIYLDDQNNFMLEFETQKGGLYYFNHGIESQYIYFEPKDSILIRLNTWDFDESLAFSGKGAEKNNFLITLYLQNEKNDVNFSRYYNLPYQNFEDKITSLRFINNSLYNQLKSSGVIISPKFDELAQIAINYSLNSKKEFYPFVYKNRKQLKEYPSLPESYYEFRKTILLNQKDFVDFAPYYSYISSYLNSISYKQASEEGLNKTVVLLTTIDRLITIDRLKNTLLYRAIYDDFRKGKNSCSINKNALTLFNKICTKKEYLVQINNLANDCEIITKSDHLDNFELVNTNNEVININSIIKNKKAVIYFWSPTIISPKMLIKKIDYIESKYPNLLLIGINMQPNKLSTAINKRLKNQYFLPKTSTAHNYVKSFEPRTVLVDDKGIVTNSFTYLTSPYLERQLTILSEK